MRFLNKYSAGEKLLLRLQREADRLGQAQADAPIVPLERPFQRGWINTYVLVDQVARRPDWQIFRSMLSVVNRRVWARDRSFVHHRTREAIVLKPRIIHYRDWDKLGWPASHARFFQFGMWREDFDDHGVFTRWKRWTCGYNLARFWWLREDVQPHLITHRRVDLPEVKTRLAEIEAYMLRHQGRERLCRLRGHRFRYFCRSGAAIARGEVHLAEARNHGPNET